MSTSYLSTYASNLALDYLLDLAYLAAHFDDPTPSGLGSTEILGGGYMRQPCSFAPGANRARVTNNSQVFTGMPESTVSWLGVWDRGVGGHLLSAYKLDTPIPVTASGQLIVAAGDIAVVF